MSAFNTAIVALCIGLLQPTHSRAADNEKSGIETTTAQAVRSLMEREGIPGVAVGHRVQRAELHLQLWHNITGNWEANYRQHAVRDRLYLLKGALIWCKRAAGARSSMKLLLVRPRASVSLIRACPWAFLCLSRIY